MNFEKLTIRYLADNDVSEFYRMFTKVKSSDFEEEKVAFDYLCEHVEKYSVIPDLSVLEAFTAHKYDEPATEPGDFYAEILRTRRAIKRTGNELAAMTTMLKTGDAEAVLKKMEDYSFNLRKSFIVDDRVVSIFEYLDDLEKVYEGIKSGTGAGIPTPWPSINNAVIGYGPGDFVLFAARSGVGKTFNLLTQADHAFNLGKKVLFITPEITQTRLLMRFAAVHLQVPYDDLRKGRLNSFIEKKFWQDMEDIKASSAESFMIMGKGMKSDVGGIRAAVHEVKPDIVFVDAIYLLNPMSFKPRDRFERMAAVADDLKKLAIDSQLPFVTTAQFNRSVSGKKVGGEAGLEGIALSDQIGWNIDWGFALLQDDDMKIDKKMIIRPIKTRESAFGSDVLIRWNFDTMDFSEIGVLSTPGKISSLTVPSYSALGSGGSSGAGSGTSSYSYAPSVKVEDDDTVPF
jgi:hypothetical protein